MRKFRNKSVVIEAFRFQIDPIPNWFMEAITSKTVVLTTEDEEGRFGIRTLEGNYDILRGDYIVRGVQSEIHLFKSDVFKDIYEEV